MTLLFYFENRYCQNFNFESCIKCLNNFKFKRIFVTSFRSLIMKKKPKSNVTRKETFPSKEKNLYRTKRENILFVEMTCFVIKLPIFYTSINDQLNKIFNNVSSSRYIQCVHLLIIIVCTFVNCKRNIYINCW